MVRIRFPLLFGIQMFYAQFARFRGIVRGQLRGLRQFPGRRHPGREDCRTLPDFRRGTERCSGWPCRGDEFLPVH